MNRIYSFSVRISDQATVEVLEELKLLSVKQGLTFSFMCTEALKRYKKEVIDLQDSRRPN